MNLRRYISWLLPYGAIRLSQKRNALKKKPPSPELPASNKTLFNRHAGQRCFILGNGPSVKNLDLSRLKGERVFSVSNGYLHPDYDNIAPQYHCLPQITYGVMTEETVISWFKEMDEHLADAELFLNESEATLVEEHGLFAGRNVHYLALRESFDELETRNIIDLTAAVPRVESVPVMVLMIAMYLGFSEIVLLGVDHDHFRSGNYLYAFDLKAQNGKDLSVSSDGVVLTKLYDEFHSLARLWRQYRALSEIAQENNIRILNATPGGELDEFPRVSFDALFKTDQENVT